MSTVEIHLVSVDNLSTKKQGFEKLKEEDCDVLGSKKPCGRSLSSGALSSRTNVNLKLTANLAVRP